MLGCGLLAGLQNLTSETSPLITALSAGDEALKSDWSFPENWETRLKQQQIITAPLAHAPSGMWKGQHLQKHYPVPVYYWLEMNRQSFYYFFSFSDSSGKDATYTKGTVSIKRSLTDGAFQSMTFILTDMPKTNISNRSYVRLYPAEKKDQFARLSSESPAPANKGIRPELQARAVLELMFHGQLLCKEQVLPVSFEKVLVMPFSELEKLTAQIINWELLLAPGPVDTVISELVNAIRRHLPLPFEDDEAFDEQGKSVHIKDLSPGSGGANCSGFVKWVIDGLYFPFMGHYIPIDVLKEKPLAIRGDRWSTKYEDVCDPFFGLDWSRNLVCQLAEARTGIEVRNKEQFDVREIDFFDYKEDVGYKISDLGLILYLLAKKHPGYFYIGSLNHVERSKPALRQHTHLVLFFPYLSTSGQYQLVVMESGTETSLANASKRFPGEYFHLVAVAAQGPLHLLPIKK
jgi:hypothetical protein